jgi:hypothetical protein
MHNLLCGNDELTMATKKPYQDLDDLEKLEKQWRKLSGLHHRKE